MNVGDDSSEEGVAEFAHDNVVILRLPVRASMKDGTVLHGFSYQRKTPPARTRSTRPESPAPVLCLPSELGTNNEHHAFALSFMAQKGAPKRLYTLNMRGRGRSMAQNITTTSIASDADDLISFCDAMSLHDCDIIASGRTGQTVLLTGPKRPGLVRRLVLNDSAPEFDSVGIARETALRQRQSAPETWEAAAANMRELKGESFPAFTDADWQEMAEIFWRDENGKPVSRLQAGLIRNSNIANYDERQPLFWQELKIFANRPVLLVHGQFSRLVTSDILQRTADVLQNCEFATAIGQGHIPQLHRDGLPNKILAFLQN